MTYTKHLLAGAAALLSLSAVDAQASSYYLGFQNPGDLSVTTVPFAWTGGVLNGTATNLIAAGTSVPDAGMFTTVVVNLSGLQITYGASNYKIFVSETGITDPSGFFKFTSQSGLTANALPPGVGLTESVYWDAGNTAYATTTLVGSETFPTTDPLPKPITGNIADASPFSLTEEFSFTLPASLDGIQYNTATIQTQLVVPEVSTWAMMLVGFAALGFGAARQGRKAQALV